MTNKTFAIRLSGAILIGSGLFGSPLAFGQEVAKPDAAAAVPVPASAELIQQGQSLFLGTKRLSAGGPACNSCHNVLNDAVPGGGSLAKDMTQTFTRIGADGILEKLPLEDEESPFPAMQRAYQGRQLITAEATALVAFLQHADAQATTQQPNNMGTKMLLAGGGGVAFLLVLFSLIGSGRKRRSVNSELFDRQISTN